MPTKYRISERHEKQPFGNPRIDWWSFVIGLVRDIFAMVNHRCAALNCQNSRKNCPGMTFVRFPKDQARCNMWIQYAKRPDLQKLKAEYLYKQAILCEEHFEDSQWMNKDMKHLGLIHTAKPTVALGANTSSHSTLRRRTTKCHDRHRKFTVSAEEIAVNLECDSEPIDKISEFDGTESLMEQECELDEREESRVETHSYAVEAHSYPHFYKQELEEEADSANPSTKNSKQEVENLKERIFQQGSKKIKASIVKMEGNRFFLVLPVPSSSS